MNKVMRNILTPQLYSAQFYSASSHRMTRTMGAGTATGSSGIFTFYCRYKRATLGANHAFISDNDADNRLVIMFNSSNQFRLDSAAAIQVVSTPTFTDPGWHRLCVAVDVTDGTAANRIRPYIDGTLITAFGTDVRNTFNNMGTFNTAVLHAIGRDETAGGAGSHFNGQLATVVLVDGTVLTPSDFEDSNGNYRKYTGSYGVNGFELLFRPGAAIGTDTSFSNIASPNNWSLVDGINGPNQGTRTYGA